MGDREAPPTGYSIVLLPLHKLTRCLYQGMPKSESITRGAACRSSLVSNLAWDEFALVRSCPSCSMFPQFLA